MGWLARLFGRLSTTPASLQDSEAKFDRLVWLEPHENLFGLRVLDCRPIAGSFLSGTTNAASIRFYGSSEARSGEQFRGKHPDEALRITSDLRYPLATPLPEGAVFLAEAMEDKWNIYHFAGVLYFARSWTGQLQYTATLALSTTELRVVELEAWPGNVLGDNTKASQQVDYLIRSHVFRQVTPHPTPPLTSKKAIALWSFSQYGRRGLYAAVENAGDRETELGHASVNGD